MSTKRRHISLPEIIDNKILEIAESKGISYSELVRRILEAYYIKHREKKEKGYG